MFYWLKTNIKMPVIVPYEGRKEALGVTEWEESKDTKVEMLSLIKQQCSQVTAVDAGAIRITPPHNVPEKNPKMRLNFVCNYPNNRQVYIVTCPVEVGGGDFRQDLEIMPLWEKLHPASRMQITYGIGEMFTARLKESVQKHNDRYNSRAGETLVDLSFENSSSKLCYVSENEWCDACDILTERIAKETAEEVVA